MFNSSATYFKTIPKTCPESITSNLLHHYDPTLSHHHLLPRLPQWPSCSFAYLSHTPLKSFYIYIKSIIIFILWVIKLCWFGPGVPFFTSFLTIPTSPYYYFAILPFFMSLKYTKFISDYRLLYKLSCICLQCPSTWISNAWLFLDIEIFPQKGHPFYNKLPAFTYNLLFVAFNTFS